MHINRTPPSSHANLHEPQNPTGSETSTPLTVGTDYFSASQEGIRSHVDTVTALTLTSEQLTRQLTKLSTIIGALGEGHERDRAIHEREQVASILETLEQQIFAHGKAASHLVELESLRHPNEELQGRKT
jgi:hypothetical protein